MARLVGEPAAGVGAAGSVSLGMVLTMARLWANRPRASFLGQLTNEQKEFPFDVSQRTPTSSGGRS
jgi:hypothetical protein